MNWTVSWSLKNNLRIITIMWNIHIRGGYMGIERKGELKSIQEYIYKRVKNCVGIAIYLLLISEFSFVLRFDSFFWGFAVILIHVRHHQVFIYTLAKLISQTKLLLYCVITAFACAVQSTCLALKPFTFILYVTTFFFVLLSMHLSNNCKIHMFTLW